MDVLVDVVGRHLRAGEAGCFLLCLQKSVDVPRKKTNIRFLECVDLVHIHESVPLLNSFLNLRRSPHTGESSVFHRVRTQMLHSVCICTPFRVLLYCACVAERKQQLFVDSGGQNWVVQASRRENSHFRESKISSSALDSCHAITGVDNLFSDVQQGTGRTC